MFFSLRSTGFSVVRLGFSGLFGGKEVVSTW
jgi:hypothetical protein